MTATQAFQHTTGTFNFLKAIQNDLAEGKVKHNKTTVEKLAARFGIDNKNLVKEISELAIYIIANSYALDKSLDFRGRFDKIVQLYYSQVNLSMRTSQSMLLQQYSTPAPIGYLMGIYISDGIPEQGNGRYFEPCAGNGLLTVAIGQHQFDSNEVDDVRLANLRTQGFHKVTDINANTDDAVNNFLANNMSNYDGVVCNPPFGGVLHPVIVGSGNDRFPLTTLDHQIAAMSLKLMNPHGRAAIIIGGHTKWDELGRIQAGKNRIFLNYLYRYYFVDEIILIDGHKLYSRQGTAFNTRLILISGEKPSPQGVAPLKTNSDVVVSDFDTLYKRVLSHVQVQSTNQVITGMSIKLQLMQNKLKLLEL